MTVRRTPRGKGPTSFSSISGGYGKQVFKEMAEIAKAIPAKEAEIGSPMIRPRGLSLALGDRPTRAVSESRSEPMPIRGSVLDDPFTKSEPVPIRGSVLDDPGQRIEAPRPEVVEAVRQVEAVRARVEEALARKREAKEKYGYGSPQHLAARAEHEEHEARLLAAEHVAKSIQVGERGGQFYISPTGAKVYVKDNPGIVVEGSYNSRAADLAAPYVLKSIGPWK